MNGIQLLIQEHDNILRMLDIIHQASLRILEGGTADVDDFKKMIDFIRKYADKTHHGKEEIFLFKTITNELGKIGENLIRHGMLVEHDIGRLYVSDLEEALEDYASSPTSEIKLSIIVAAGSYEKLLRRHIQKENDVIFTFAKNKLSQESLELLDKQTQDYEFDSANTAEREQQLMVLAELEKKYI